MGLLDVIKNMWNTPVDFNRPVVFSTSPPPIVNKPANNISVQGICELASYEGLCNTVYLDSGNVRTTAIGLTVSEIPDIAYWSWARSLTNQQCVSMFKSALVKYVNGINQVLAVPVAQWQFDALVSITYNIGVGDVRSLHGGMAGSTFMRLINQRADPQAIVHAMQMWENDNGRHIKGLENRRNAESAVYLTGKYKNNGYIQHIIADPVTHREVPNGLINIRPYL
jgi:lysozyme